MSLQFPLTFFSRHARVKAFLAAPKGVLDTKRPPSPTELRVFLAPGRRMSITVNERSVLSISLYSTLTLFFNIMLVSSPIGSLTFEKLGGLVTAKGASGTRIDAPWIM